MNELRRMRDEEPPDVQQRRSFHFLPAKHKLALINFEPNTETMCVFVVSSENHDNTYRFSQPHPAFCEDSVDEDYIKAVLGEISALSTLYYHEKLRSEAKSFGTQYWTLVPVSALCLAGFAAHIVRLYIPHAAFGSVLAAGVFCTPWRLISSCVLHRSVLALRQCAPGAVSLVRHQGEPLREDRCGVQTRAGAAEQQVHVGARVSGLVG